MDDTLNTFPDRDTDCTSRSLATLLVAWVGAAMVASVLLRWKYMWIALAILTLLFLIACGYAACNARSAHQRIACRTDRPIVRRRSMENVQTVSRIVDGNYVVDPPAYQTFWITDLPPSYSAVIRAQPPNYHLTSVDEFAIGPRLSNPPPYTMVIQSDVLNTSNGQPTNRTQEAHLSSFPAGINQQSRGEPWPLDTFPHNNNNNNNNFNNDINSNNNSNIIVRRQSFSEISQINEDKEPKERRRSRSIGTHYFSNIIINCTFSRNERRTNDENINHTPTIEQRVDANQNHSSSTNDNSESKI